MPKHLENELLTQAEGILNFGIWELNLKTNSLTWSDGVFKIYGYEPQEFEVNYEKNLSIIHPDDRALTIAQMQNAIATGEENYIKNRIITKNQTIKHINFICKLLKDKQGNPLKLFGVLEEVMTSTHLEDELNKSLLELKARNQFIEIILQNLPIGIAINKIDTGEATIVNKLFANAYGWQNIDFKDINSFFEKVYPDENYRKEITGKIIADIQSGDVKKMNWTGIKVTSSTGEQKIIDAKNIPLFDQNLMISTVLDVTEKTELETENRKINADLKALLENTPDIIYSISLNFKLLTYNSAFYKIVSKLGLGEIKRGIDIFTLYSDEKRELYSAVFLIVKQGKRYAFEDELIINGESVYFDVSVNPILNDDNEVIGVSVFSRDITEQNQKEREIERIKINQDYIINGTSDLIWSINNQMQLIIANQAFHQMIEIATGKKIQIGDYIMIPDFPEGLNKIWFDYYQRGLRGESFTEDYFDDYLGSPNYNLVSFSPMVNSKQEIWGLACYCRSTTKEKLNFLELEKKENELKKIMDSSMDVICTIDEFYNFVKVSAASEKVWGYKPEEIEGKPFINLVYPADHPKTIEAAVSIMAGNNTTSFENRYISKNGEIVPIIWSARWDKDDRIVYCTAKNATDLNKKDEEIRRTNQVLKNAQKLAQIGNYELNLSTNEVYCSDEIYNIYEIDRKVQPFFTPQDFLNLTHPDDLENLLHFRSKLVKIGDVSSILHRIVTKNNNFKYVRQVVEFVYDEKTKSNWLYGTVRDSTKIIQDQQEIENSKEKYRYLFDNNPAAMFIFNFESLKIIDCNQEALELYGYKREEFLSLTIRDIRPAEDIELTNNATKSEEIYGQIHKDTWRHQKKNGELMFVNINGHLIDFDNKRCSLVQITNITEKLKAENATKASELQRELIMNAALDAIICINKKGEVTFWNPQAEHIFGWKYSEVLGKSLTNLIVPNVHRHAHDSGMKHYLKTKEGPVLNKLLELTALNKEGKEFPIELTVIPIKQGDDEFFCSFIRDITKRKTSEHLILESEVKYRTMIECSMDAILLTVKNGEILSINEAACQIFQMTHDEVLAAGRNGLVDLTDPRLIQLLEERERVGKVRGELTFKRKDGSKFPGEITSVVFKDAHGQERTSMVIRDISAQKNAEKEIIESNQRFQFAAKATFDTIWDWNFKTDEIYWGEGLISVFGYHLDNNISDIEFWTKNIHPEDYERVSNSINQSIANKDSQSNWIEEYRFLKADGTYAFVLDRGIVITNEQNEAVRMVGAIQNITKKKEEDLRLKLLESVVTNTNDAVLITEAEVFNNDGPRILYINEAFTKMTGYLPIEVIGKTPKILQGPKTDKNELKKLNKAIQNWETCETTVINYKKNGDEFYINFTISPVADSKGSFTHWIAVERDVTENVLAQQKLLAAYDERNTILESIKDGFFATDKNLIVTYWNKRAEELLDEKRKNIIGKNLFKIFANLDSMAFHDHYVKAVNEYKTVHFEEFSIRSNKWFEVSAFASENGLSVYFKDVTDKKIIEEQIKSERNLLRTLIDNLPDTIYVKDKNARKIISNKHDYNFVGFKNEEDVLGKTDLELFDNELGNKGYNHDINIIKTGQALINFEEYYRKKDGSAFWLLTTKVPLRNNENKIIGLLGIGRDITVIKTAQENIKNVNIELEKNIKQLKISNQELEQFAYVASHDLQEPLRMITSFLTQLEKKYNDILDEKGKQYIYFAVDGAKRMRQIILDLLEYSRVGRQTEDLEEVDVNELIKDIQTLYKKQITEVSASIICGRFPKIYSHSIPIRQVLQNLISNALKYHHQFKPTKLNIDVLENENNWQFSVKDNGIGIDEEYHQKIFIIFQRLHNKDEYTGTGMGLAICKKIIENLGGEIWVETNKNEGSCFYFTIPKTKFDKNS